MESVPRAHGASASLVADFGQVTRVYRFNDCELDPRGHELRRGGEAVRLERQVFAVLVHLVANRERVVPKAELLDAVWGNRFVSDSALTSRLKDARRAVGDDGQQQNVIATVHGVGYRFVAQVDVDGHHETVPPEGQATTQEIRFCRSPDGVRLAFATCGSGPPLVKAANWLTHLDHEWTSSIWRHWIQWLASRTSADPLRRARLRPLGLGRRRLQPRRLGRGPRAGRRLRRGRPLPPPGCLAGRRRCRRLRPATPGTGHPTGPDRSLLPGSAGPGAR